MMFLDSRKIKIEEMSSRKVQHSTGNSEWRIRSRKFSHNLGFILRPSLFERLDTKVDLDFCTCILNIVSHRITVACACGDSAFNSRSYREEALCDKKQLTIH